jgi:hypothetical protein
MSFYLRRRKWSFCNEFLGHSFIGICCSSSNGSFGFLYEDSFKGDGINLIQAVKSGKPFWRSELILTDFNEQIEIVLRKEDILADDWQIQDGFSDLLKDISKNAWPETVNKILDELDPGFHGGAKRFAEKMKELMFGKDPEPSVTITRSRFHEAWSKIRDLHPRAVVDRVSLAKELGL